MIHTLIFDFDGTLHETGRMYVAAFQETCYQINGNSDIIHNSISFILIILSLRYGLSVSCNFFITGRGNRFLFCKAK